MSDDTPDKTVVSVLTEGDECPHCGASEYGSQDAITKSKAGNLMCRHCAYTFHDDGNAVPKEDLRALVEEWRDFSDVQDWNDYNQGISEGIKSCADELEDLLSE